MELEKLFGKKKKAGLWSATDAGGWTYYFDFDASAYLVAEPGHMPRFQQLFDKLKNIGKATVDSCWVEIVSGKTVNTVQLPSEGWEENDGKL